MVEQKLTLADQFVVNALFYLAAPITVRSEGEERAVIAEMSVQLKACNWNNPRMEPLIELAREWVDATHKPGKASFDALYAVRLRAGGILADFALWRMGLIQAALRPAPKGDAA